MCLFYKILRGFVPALFFLYAGFAWAGTVEISEIAWMGTAESSYCEWVELYNTDNNEVDLAGWRIYEQGGSILIMSLSKKISPNGYYLIERSTNSCPDPVPSVVADDSGSFGGSGLTNAGEILVLKDASGSEIDRVDGSNSRAVGGNNTTKETLQRTSAGWITATSTPKAPPPDASSSSSSSTSTPSAPSSGSSQSESSSSVGGAYIEEIGPKAVIYSVSSGIAGAGTVFDGAVYDVSDKEISPERYFWNFGDGAYAEGKKVIHTFRFPARYQVSFSAKVGSRITAAYREVEILPNKIFISEVKPGPDSWLELFNSSPKKLNIAGWILRSSTSTFIFPEESYILPQTFLVVSGEISRIIFPPEGQAELLYPNGSPADKFSYSGALGDGQSFQRDSPNLIRMDVATPAAGLQKYESPNSGFGAGKNPSPPAQVYNQESEVAFQAAASTSPEINPENQTALLPRFNFSGSFYSWALLSLGAGVLAALGFVASRRL